MSKLSDFISSSENNGSGSGSFTHLSEKQLANDKQKEFNLTTITYKKGYKDLRVSVNGADQSFDSSSYQENTPSKITFSEPLKKNDVVKFSVIRMV